MFKKIQSRKFIAFFVWCCFVIVAFIFSPENIPVIIPWSGGISLIYVGSQAAIDWKNINGGK